MTKEIAQALLGATLVLTGLAGSHYGIQYSGWVLFVGLLVIVELAC